MNRYSEAFSRFYKTPVKIYGIKSGSSYSKAAVMELLCSVNADIQPYGGGLSEEDFGLSVSRRFKMYCGECDDVREGNYAEFDGKRYRIVLVERWNMGITAILDGEV